MSSVRLVVRHIRRYLSFFAPLTTTSDWRHLNQAALHSLACAIWLVYLKTSLDAEVKKASEAVRVAGLLGGCRNWSYRSCNVGREEAVLYKGVRERREPRSCKTAPRSLPQLMLSWYSRSELCTEVCNIYYPVNHISP
jgi:hypothetical protein